MKKLLAVLTALALLCSCAGAETAAAPETAAAHETETLSGMLTGPLTEKHFPWYFGSKDNARTEDESLLPLWFAEGAEDLPFMELSEWAELMETLMNDGVPEKIYFLYTEADQENQSFTMSRENGYTASFSFRKGTVSMTDYLAFVTPPNSVYLGTDAYTNIFASDEPYLVTITDSRYRYGELTELKLNDYEIPMIVQDGHFLVPLQTVSFLFLAPMGFGTYFNGEAAFIMRISDMENPQEILEAALRDDRIMTPETEAKLEAYSGPAEEEGKYILETIAESSEAGENAIAKYLHEMETSVYPVYASAPKAPRSKALARYGFFELCLELDCFYGLKESHSISSFEQFFAQTGLLEGLLSPDAGEADRAVKELTRYWFDDGHSSFISGSYLTEGTPRTADGYSLEAMKKTDSEILRIRDGYPNASLPYYEVGDTAYVTFDAFEVAPSDLPTRLPDYYGLYGTEDMPNDTIGIIINAHRQITRENSPIKNVVLDMSCNSGGLATTAIYTLAWFLGEAQVSIHDTFTGAESTISYRADVNMDHVCDENDTLAGRGMKLYCLITPSSFSCANLVPWGFKENGRVTLLGRASGGGSCIVQSMNTAWGTSYSMSGPSRLAFTKNGSYYDVDRGVEPDHAIDSYEHLFDREALTEYIHGLF